METPFCRLVRERRCFADCVEAMGLESKFNRYMENGYPGWQELEQAKFDSAAEILFQEIVKSEPLSNDMIIAEATFLALSGATNSRKQYKEVEEFFDEVWDGNLDRLPFAC